VSYPTVEALAAAAGSTPAQVEGMLALGLLEHRPDGFRPADITRVRLVDAAEGSGIMPELIADVVASGRYSMGWVDILDPDPVPSTAMTMAELADELGVEVAVLERAYTVGLSLSAPEPDTVLRSDDVELLRAFGLGAQLSGVPPEDQALAIRFFGENLRRVAESQLGYLRERIFDPMLASGMSVSEVIEALTPTAREMRTLGDRAVQLLHARHVDHEAMEAIITNLELAMDEAGIRSRAEGAPAIAFVDLTDSTGITERAGDEAALGLVEGLTKLTATVERAGGKTVKYLGDGVMLHFVDPQNAVPALLDLVDAASSFGLPSARAGLHSGRVIFRDGDYFGRTVIMAARISDAARPEEVLVTREIRDASGEGIAFEERGRVPLKGLRDPIELFRAMRAG
jgi:adenylate cyclase